jgi:SpoIID/LytB domain protein
VRGDIRAVEGLDNTARTVNALDMQGYLRGSVPRESPASWGALGGGAGMNALRAQAIAARSYAWAEDRAPYAKTCDTTECQVYGGRALQTSGGFIDLEHPLTDAAVAETAGQVRLLNGAVARTEYSSSTGGYTAGGTFPAVPDEGDAISSNPNHNWHRSIPVGQVQSTYPSVGTLNAIRITQRNGLGDFGGRPLQVVIEGSAGSVTRTGTQFQFDLGLLSDFFTIAVPPRGPGIGPVAIRPDGVIESTPDAAAFRGQDRLDVVVRGTDGFYWTMSATGATWSPWRGLGTPPGGPVGEPTVVSWAPGRLDVFVRGADNRLWQTFTENGGASWSGWLKPFGDDGVLASSPEAASRAPGQLDVLVVGTDNQIYQRFYEGAWNESWLGQGRPSAGIKSDPAAASMDSSRLDLFVQGSDDKLWQRSWNGSSWSAWFQPVGTAGTLASSPDAISWGPGNLLVFIRGTDSGMYALLGNNGFWDPWKRLVGEEDVTPNGPGATSRGANRWDVFVRGIDSRVYLTWV